LREFRVLDNANESIELLSFPYTFAWIESSLLTFSGNFFKKIGNFEN